MDELKSIYLPICELSFALQYGAILAAKNNNNKKKNIILSDKMIIGLIVPICGAKVGAQREVAMVA